MVPVGEASGNPYFTNQTTFIHNTYSRRHSRTVINRLAGTESMVDCQYIYAGMHKINMEFEVCWLGFGFVLMK